MLSEIRVLMVGIVACAVTSCATMPPTKVQESGLETEVKSLDRLLDTVTNLRDQYGCIGWGNSESQARTDYVERCLKRSASQDTLAQVKPIIEYSDETVLAYRTNN